MALYDKASLVLIPSGTKAGKVFSQKPVPSNDVLGDELVTNGTFDTDSDWTKGAGWSISGGKAYFDNSTGTEFYQSLPTSVGKYIISFDLEITNGTVQTSFSSPSVSAIESFSTSGTKLFEITTTSSFSRFRFVGFGNSVFNIDNVSVRQVVDGDFDFTRSSYATRVNSQGLIEKERSNLLLQSNNFDTTWSTDDVDTPTSGILGYDGTNDGWLLNISGDTTSQHIKQTVSNSGVQTFSVYAKANTLDWMLLYVSTSTLTRGYFDIANGSLGSSNNLIDSKITDAGNGWYRCSITFNESITDARVYLANANNSIVQSSGSIYIQDAQVEQGLVATDVIETTTSAVYTGITDNVPRLDYDGDCPSLLLEPQRINIVPNSEYASGYGTNGTGTTTDNANTSPEGLNNAFQLEDTSTGDYYRIEHYHAFSAGDYTFSVFIKKTTGALSHYSGIQLDVTRKYVIVDTTNGTFTEFIGTTNDNVAIEDFSEDWWRISITNNLTAATHRIAIWAAISENGTGINTNATGSNLYYGLQLEEGSYATSYIPTYGTSVTRNADVCNNAGDSTIFNDAEGVLYFEAKTDNENVGSISINDGTLSNRLAARFRPDISKVQLTVIGTTDDFNYNSATITLTEYNKIAIVYNNSQYYFFVNGEKSTIQNRGTFDSNDLTQLDFNRGGGGERFYGDIKVLAYFNRALTDEELAELTQV